MKLNKLTSKFGSQYVESAVIPPIRISAGTPVLALKFSRRFFVRILGSVVLPTNSSKNAVSILKLARDGCKKCDASGGSVGELVNLRTGRLAETF